LSGDSGKGDKDENVVQRRLNAARGLIYRAFTNKRRSET